MQDIEPFYNWQHLYITNEDDQSSFYKQEYNELEYTQTIYNYYIHPHWDFFGSRTLYMKVLYADYEQRFAIIELFGEWNDAIENDIMTLRREVTDEMYKKGITKYILIAENVLNFHSSDDSYYEEWAEQLEDDNGWVVLLNLPEQSAYDFKKARLTNYINFLEIAQWRTWLPDFLFQAVEAGMGRRIG